MATLPPVNRTQIAMELIRTSEVTTLANYAEGTLDYIAGATAIKYAQAAWDYSPGTAEDPANPTNPELAINWINMMREYNRTLLRTSRVPSARDTAGASEQATVDAEVDSELGTDE